MALALTLGENSQRTRDAEGKTAAASQPPRPRSDEISASSQVPRHRSDAAAIRVFEIKRTPRAYEDFIVYSPYILGLPARVQATVPEFTGRDFS